MWLYFITILLFFVETFVHLLGHVFEWLAIHWMGTNGRKLGKVEA